MKKKILWLGLSFLLVAALVLASCGKAEPGEQEEEEEEPVGEQEEEEEEEEEEEPVGQQEEEEEPAAGAPQYGGTLTVMIGAGKGDPASPDIADGSFWSPSQFLNPIQERPVIGDFEKYGPRGTGEYAFQVGAYQPEVYMKGHLLESWEISPDKTIWNIRPGVYWAADNVDYMENRELTAEDVVADLIYFREAAGGKSFKDITGDIYTTGKYSLVIEHPSFDINMMYFVGYEDRALISPPEMVVAGAGEWKNQVGTGPYLLKEYVVGSQMTFERNPNWWKTTVIDGVEYTLPFISNVVVPIIPDPATQVAALRTGTLDFSQDVSAMYWQTLSETNPDLLSVIYGGSSGAIVILKTSEPPFNNVDVRRALMIGTDIKAFAELAGVGPLPLHWYPVYLGDPAVYTPLEELPADIQILYNYDPDLAAQMLADIYPDGLTVDHYVESVPASQDRADLLAYLWAKIGVTINIKVHDTITIRGFAFDGDYTGSLSWPGAGVGNPLGDGLIRRGETGGFYNYSLWSNESFDVLAAKAKKAVNPVERNSAIKEAALIMLRETPQIPLSPLVTGRYWWPWIKNYYSELSAGDGEVFSLLSHAWIDQDLKTSLGY